MGHCTTSEMPAATNKSVLISSARRCREQNGQARDDLMQCSGDFERRCGRHKMAHDQHVEPVRGVLARGQRIVSVRESDGLITECGQYLLFSEQLLALVLDHQHRLAASERECGQLLAGSRCRSGDAG